MTPEDADQAVDEARRQARRARFMSAVWWVQVPLVSVAYWLISTEQPIEKAMLVYLACVSLIANAVTYSGKATAAEAKQAGYDHP